MDQPWASLLSDHSLPANSPIDTCISPPKLTIEQPQPTILSGLVVAEVRSLFVPLEDHLPQVVVEMYTCAKALGLVPSLSLFDLYL